MSAAFEQKLLKGGAVKNQTMVEQIDQQYQLISPNDNMAEAGRKAILGSFIQMLEHEAGSRDGTDIEDIHKMRVATRRMRSLFNLLSPYFRTKTTKSHTTSLKEVADCLGGVRDLDVQIQALGEYAESRPEEEQESVKITVAILTERRQEAHQKLVDLMDSKKYQKFIGRLWEFLTSPGKGAKEIDTDAPIPYQVRHLLPVIIQEHISQVRAYDTVIADADEPTFHALRINCKRLRYLVTAFQGILGTSSAAFIDDLKKLQDHLGAMQDAVVGEEFFTRMRKQEDLNKRERGALKAYVKHLKKQYNSLHSSFEEEWESFNTRAVQRKISDALLVLR